MKVTLVFILFFAMIFSLEMYLDRVEQDIQNSHAKESSIVIDNTINSTYTELASWFNPLQF